MAAYTARASGGFLILHPSVYFIPFIYNSLNKTWPYIVEETA